MGRWFEPSRRSHLRSKYQGLQLCSPFYFDQAGSTSNSSRHPFKLHRRPLNVTPKAPLAVPESDPHTLPGFVIEAGSFPSYFAGAEACPGWALEASQRDGHNLPPAPSSPTQRQPRYSSSSIEWIYSFQSPYSVSSIKSSKTHASGESPLSRKKRNRTKWQEE